MEAFLLLCNAVLTLVIVYMAIRDDGPANRRPTSFFKTKADDLSTTPSVAQRSRLDRARDLG